MSLDVNKVDNIMPT